METLEKTIHFKLRNDNKNENIQLKAEKVKQLPGVNNVSSEKDRLTVNYDPYAVSEKFLVKCLSGVGFDPAPEKKKGFFARWINSLAQSNQKTYGNQRLDCCNVKRV